MFQVIIAQIPQWEMQEKQGNIEIKEPEYVLIATVHEIQCGISQIFLVLDKNKSS